MLVYSQSASMMSSLSAARSDSAIRESANAAAASIDRPLSVISRTLRAMRSMKVEAPGVAAKRTVVREPNTSGPVVRSRTTS